MTSRAVRIVQLIALLLALASYWAPWVAHPTAGLAIAEVDFVEFPKFMPQVRSGELSVWREAFYVPLLVLSVASVVWAAFPRASRSAAVHSIRWRPDIGRWIARLFALFLLVTPSIFNVYEPGEFQTQLRLEAFVLLCIFITPFLRRLPIRGLHAALAPWFVFGAVAPSLQFLQMKPALEAIYNEPITVGWGLWAGIAGFGLLAVCELSYLLRKTK